MFYLVWKEIHFPYDYIWISKCRKVQSYPVIKYFLTFYQDAIISFNMAKSIKPFGILNKYEVVEQPQWGNEPFRIRDACHFYKRRISHQIIYCILVHTDTHT